MFSRRINPQPNYKEVFNRISSVNRNLNAKSYKEIILSIIDESVSDELLNITITSTSDLSGLSEQELLKQIFR